MNNEKMIINLSRNCFKELKDAKKYIMLAKNAKELGLSSATSDLKNIAEQEMQHYHTNKKILESLVTEEDKKHYFYKMQMEELKDMCEEIKNFLNEI